MTPLWGAQGLIAQAEAKAVRKSLIGAWTELRLGAGWSWGSLGSLTVLYAFTSSVAVHGATSASA